MHTADHRVPVLYLAPWLDVGGSDKGTLDWFRFLDRDRFRPSLITTQPSANRRLAEGARYADEVWDLTDLMPGNDFARFILTFIDTREVKLVHIMNSRLGFELLPDIAHMPAQPRVVVQLHVEEPDCSGYVRYVTTRYGNLVDAFSVSSQALRDALEPYDVPASKRRLIRTGVDAEREFSPAHVKPVGGLDPDLFHILFPARLTAQKDPLLMVDVAARLRDSGVRFRVHVLGDGDLDAAVRDRIAILGLKGQVIVHGTCVEIAPWYAACDVVLLTSEFEGVPYAIYEAMAMATPVVVPDLPGVAELVTPGTGVLVRPREEPGAYADALAALSSDPSRRQAMGSAARSQARSDLTLERMAAEHADLYEELLAMPREQFSERELPAPAAAPEPPLTPGLRSRRPGATPLVSVIVPCYNHGRYVRACIESIAAQTYAPIETILVDNGSTDPDTLQALAEIEADGIATLMRIAVNRGPSVARNAAIERATGRFVLPVDADNLLLPDAVGTLVEQLSSAGEHIGFVFPNYQFFGNRTEYFEPPSYNLHALLTANYCDTCSLIDSEVFERGFRYPEDIALGMEDWDLVLSLAEHRIYGEPARVKTLLYRKHGFNRADLVEAGSVPFSAVVAERHPRLFDRRRAQLKGEWSPAISIIALDPVQAETGDALPNLVKAAWRQTCEDFEVVVRTTQDVWPTALRIRLRRIPSALASSRAEALRHGIEIARGRHILATYGSPAALLADTTLVEKVLRALRANPNIEAIALVEGEHGLSGFRLLHAVDVESAQLGALCWPATGPSAPPPSLELSGHHPLEELATWLSVHATTQWRHLPRRDRRAVSGAGDGGAVPIGAPRHRRARDARIRAEGIPQLPDLASGVAERVRGGVWMPPQAHVLCRHLHHPSGRYVFTTGVVPPPDCSPHYHLGSLRGLPLAGTVSLRVRDDSEESPFALGEDIALDAVGLLGFVEQAPLPLFDPIWIARHRATGQRVLIAGAEDPLAGSVDELTFIGFIEPYPIHPRTAPHADVPYGLVGLIRALDLRARTHRYGAGRLPEGQLAGELGALLTKPVGDCAPLWIDAAGRVFPDGRAPVGRRPSPRTLVRWTGAPLTWRGFGSPGHKARAAVRRACESARILTSPPECPASCPSEPAGYLLRSPGHRTAPLYSATHPVTGDQLLSTTESESRYLGYKHTLLLGHLVARAPVTGTMGIVRPGVPWASRFGLLVGE